MTSFFRKIRIADTFGTNLQKKNRSKCLKVKKDQSIIELQKVKVSQSQKFKNRRKNECFVKHVKKQKLL